MLDWLRRLLCKRRQPASSPAARARLVAQLRWRVAVKRVLHLLARRRAWAAEGQALQARELQALVSGLERRRSRLFRVSPGAL